jgi:hypothetical protein
VRVHVAEARTIAGVEETTVLEEELSKTGKKDSKRAEGVSTSGPAQSGNIVKTTVFLQLTMASWHP